MILIIADTYEEKIAITGLLELGCKSCKEAMGTGFGNPKLCDDCHKKDIVIKQVQQM